MATPTYPVATPLVYHCGICGSDLDDENSLFTSCGHFFCSKKGPNPCTKHAANTTGTCEQCETTCNFGALQRQGEGHSTRVRAYVFDDVAAKLRATAEILDFRATHAGILKETVGNLKVNNEELTISLQKHRDEIQVLKAQNQALREQNEHSLKLLQEAREELATGSNRLPQAERDGGVHGNDPRLAREYRWDSHPTVPLSPVEVERDGGGHPSDPRSVREPRWDSHPTVVTQGAGVSNSATRPIKNLQSSNSRHGPVNGQSEPAIDHRLSPRQSDMDAPLTPRHASARCLSETPRGGAYRASGRATHVPQPGQEVVRAARPLQDGTRRYPQSVARTRETRQGSTNAVKSASTRAERALQTQGRSSMRLRSASRAQSMGGIAASAVAGEASKIHQTRHSRPAHTRPHQSSDRAASSWALRMTPSSLNRFASDNSRATGAMRSSSVRRQERLTGNASVGNLAYKRPAGSVPRPSATPDQLARPVKRMRSLENPLGGTYKR